MKIAHCAMGLGLEMVKGKGPVFNRPLNLDEDYEKNIERICMIFKWLVIKTLKILLGILHCFFLWPLLEKTNR